MYQVNCRCMISFMELEIDTWWWSGWNCNLATNILQWICLTSAST